MGSYKDLVSALRKGERKSARKGVVKSVLPSYREEVD